MVQTILKILYGVVIVGVIGLTLLLIASFFSIADYQVKVVLSGSMRPTIETGSIVVITSQERYTKDDIITFTAEAPREVPITHRIVERDATNGSVSYVTRGDANDAPDESRVQKDEVIGKVLFSVPYVGYLITFAKQPLGFLLLIGIPAAIITIDELRTIVREVRRIRRRRRNDTALSEEGGEE